MEFNVKSFLLTFILVEGFYYGSIYIILHVAPSTICIVSSQCFDFTSLSKLKDVVFNFEFIALSVTLAFFAAFVRIGTYEVLKDMVKMDSYTKTKDLYYFYYIFMPIMLIITILLRSVEFLAVFIVNLFLLILASRKYLIEKKKKPKGKVKKRAK